jgi:hypothetical protein
LSLEHKEAARVQLQSLAAKGDADPAADVMENPWPMMLLFGGLALGSLGFGAWSTMKGTYPLGLGMLALGLLLAWLTWIFALRGRRPVMHLAPSGLSGGGLAAELPWSAIHDLKMTVLNDSTCTIEVMLADDAQPPRLLHGNLRRMAYRARKRRLFINMSRVKGMSHGQLLEKIERYRYAAYAVEALKDF